MQPGVLSPKYDRLEKQPTDLRQKACYFGDRTLVYRLLNPLSFAAGQLARAKCRCLDHNGRASNAEKQPTGRGPEGCVENGSAGLFLVSPRLTQRSSLPPPRTPP